MGHAARVMVAGTPATGAVGEFHLVGGKHDRQLHRVVRIHFAALYEGNRYMIRIFPFKPQEEVGVIVGCLNFYRYGSTLARDGC